MQKTLSDTQVEAFYHDHFVASQVQHFTALLARAAGVVVDVGGGCGFFADALQRRTDWRVRVLDTDTVSVRTCQAKGVDATVGNALAPPIGGDEDVACFNLILHHLVGEDEAATRHLQQRALAVWRSPRRCIFVNEYIYDSYFGTLSGRLIFEITRSRLLSALAKAVSRVVPSLRANTFGVGVRFRAYDEWVRLFASQGFRVAATMRGDEEHVSPARRLLMIRSCRRDSFLLEPDAAAAA
jgi:hypothetical protein